ncbi:17618_t:CDS:2, partial [Acaulospora colombiana]
MTQETATTSSTSISSIEETDEIKKYCYFWWKTGNIHLKAGWEEATLPYVLKTDVTLDEYIKRTDMHNVHALWEWEKGTVRVIELPSSFHEDCIATIIAKLGAIFDVVSATSVGIKFSGATTTKTRGGGKEPDGSLRPVGKPQVSGGGSDGRNRPWPNLVIEVAYSETEAHLKDKIENYWLLPNRVHDAIAIKLNYTPDYTVPTEMTVSLALLQTAVGALNPVMYEFGTINRQGNPINILPGQCVINIQLGCIYHGMPNNF